MQSICYTRPFDYYDIFRYASSIILKRCLHEISTIRSCKKLLHGRVKLSIFDSQYRTNLYLCQSLNVSIKKTFLNLTRKRYEIFEIIIDVKLMRLFIFFK